MTFWASTKRRTTLDVASRQGPELLVQERQPHPAATPRPAHREVVDQAAVVGHEGGHVPCDLVAVPGDKPESRLEVGPVDVAQMPFRIGPLLDHVVLGKSFDVGDVERGFVAAHAQRPRRDALGPLGPRERGGGSGDERGGGGPDGGQRVRRRVSAQVDAHLEVLPGACEAASLERRKALLTRGLAPGHQPAGHARRQRTGELR